MGIFDFLFGKKTAEQKAPVGRTFALAGMTDEQISQYFRNILVSNFSEYELKEKVEVTGLAGDVSDSFKLYKTRPTQEYKAEWGEPYTFVMYKEGVAQAVVMVGDQRSHHQRVKYLISRMYAKKLGLPYINFYTNLPNEDEYVVERIKKFLTV